MAKKGRRKRRCRVWNKNTDDNTKKNFEVKNNVVKEIVDKSGGIITEQDIKKYFKTK